MANNHSAFLARLERPEVADREGAPVSDDERGPALEVLRDPRRWMTIRILEAERDQTVDRRAIARRIAESEADARGSADRLVRHVEISLHHKHLPVLDEADIVDYDPDTGITTYSPSSELERRLAAVVE